MARSQPTAHHEAPARIGRRRAEAGSQPLTDIERRILDFMVKYLRVNTYQPSIREIGERFGIKSTKTVSEHLQALADKGFLERDPSRSRGVKILGVDLSADSVSLPCFSELPGEASGALGEQAETHLAIDRRLAGGDGSFFVRASGTDLAVLGVAEGDYVLVEPASVDEVKDGAVVAARIGKDAAFHRLTRNGTGVTLEALHPGAGKTEMGDGAELSLLGRVTAFYRRMDEAPGTLNLTQH